MQIKNYAPIIIPTLCRYEHFKCCIESLARCTGADQTELFVGLDYPKNESHRIGYEKIKEYVGTITGFKEVHIFYREENYGVRKNTLDLRREVEERFDRYIFTEDDNEFSPNFLEYMNQGLEIYKDNPKVVAICGYTYPFDYCQNIKGYPYNAYPIKGFCAWGGGYWVERNKMVSPFVTQESACNLINSWKLIYKLFRKKNHITVHRLLFRYKTAYKDLMWRVYCELNDAYCIFPQVSKVRNNGFDGSGLNCMVTDIYTKQEIDKMVSFEFDEFEIKSYKQIDYVHDKLYSGSWIKRRICELEYLYFRLTGCHIHQVHRYLKAIKQKICK